MFLTRMPLPRRVAAVVAAAVLTAGGALAAASAASATPKPRPAATRLAISNKVIAHSKHRVDAVTGVLSAGHAGVAHQVVTLMARAGTAPRWKVIATNVTGAGGAVTFSVAPKVKTQVELVFAGATGYRGSHSNVVTLRPVR